MNGVNAGVRVRKSAYAPSATVIAATSRTRGHPFPWCACHASATSAKGSRTASSFDSSAAKTSSVPTARWPRTNATAARSADNVSRSAVRPLIQTTAMAIPWGLSAQASAASAAATGETSSVRSSQTSAAAHAAYKSRFEAPYARAPRPKSE